MKRNIVKEINDLSRNLKDHVANGFDPKKYLNMTQLQILNYLLKHKEEDVCQKDLEIETNLKKASITGCLDILEDMNLIERCKAADDKRKNYIKLTDRVLNFESEFEKRIHILNENILRNINEEELINFYNVIDKVKQNVKEAN